MTTIRWGILSTAKIGTEKVIPAMQRGTHTEITAIASSDPAKAALAAGALNIPKQYGSYEALLGDPDIDAVYIPLPNHLHVEWAINALHAGKHVLCEKPLGMNAADAARLLAASREFPKLKVMEAFMYRFHPQWQAIKKQIADGVIGDVKHIEAMFSYYNTNPADIRNQKDIGGGGLLDIGCYCISLSRLIFGEEPGRVLGSVRFDPQSHVDILASGVLEFPTGTSTFTCSTQLTPSQHAVIFGTKGKIVIEWPFTPPTDTPTSITVHTEAGTRTIPFEQFNQYTAQGDLFSLAVMNDTSVPTPLTDAIANMTVIDAVFESGRTGTWVDAVSQHS
jgi:predicted dehydrogenase